MPARVALNVYERKAAQGIARARAQLMQYPEDGATRYRMRLVADEVIVSMATEDYVMPHPDLIRAFMEEANCGA